jgi:predicted AlkP superfamily phosphohydrolase/phosphomutase
MSILQEKRERSLERMRTRKANREKVSKSFRFESTAEEADFKMTQEYNGIDFEIFRKGVTQSRGKEVSYILGKKEVEELRDYLTKALDNWEEWNALEK